MSDPWHPRAQPTPPPRVVVLNASNNLTALNLAKELQSRFLFHDTRIISHSLRTALALAIDPHKTTVWYQIHDALHEAICIGMDQAIGLETGFIILIENLDKHSWHCKNAFTRLTGFARMKGLPLVLVSLDCGDGGGVANLLSLANWVEGDEDNREFLVDSMMEPCLPPINQISLDISGRNFQELATSLLNMLDTADRGNNYEAFNNKEEALHGRRQ